MLPSKLSPFLSRTTNAPHFFAGSVLPVFLRYSGVANGSNESRRNSKGTPQLKGGTWSELMELQKKELDSLEAEKAKIASWIQIQKTVMDAEAERAKTMAWSKSMEIQKNEMDALNVLDIERAKIEEEKKQTSNFKGNPIDIVTINAGGTIIEAHRDTLCLAEGSAFSNMFITGHQQENNSVFLDHDPEMIQLIVNHLRAKKIENPSKPIGQLIIPEKKKNQFISLIEHLGLDEFFFPVSPLPCDLQPVDATSSAICVVSNGEGKIRVTCSDWHDNFGVAFTPTLDALYTNYWKCTVVAMDEVNAWRDGLFLGVIGKTQSKCCTFNSHKLSTSFGWGGAEKPYATGLLYAAGRYSSVEGWTGFEKDEVLYFRLQNQTLTMHSVAKQKSFHINDVPANSNHIHFSLCGKVVVELEPLPENEKAAIRWENKLM